MTETGKIKVLFTIPTMTGGGAERMLRNLLKGMDRGRFSLFLLLHNREGSWLDDIPGDVPVYDLRKRKRLDGFRMVFSLAWKIFPRVKPDVVVSFLEYSNLVTLAAAWLARPRPPVVISERTLPSLLHAHYRAGRIKGLLLKHLYPRANGIIAVSRGIRDDLSSSYAVPPSLIRVIPNCVDPVEIANLSREPIPAADGFTRGEPVVVACGSFKREKNYPLLIRAFARVLRNIPARLAIVGDGPERGRMEDLAAALGIEKKVIFLGYRKNSFKYMARADIFVLSSSWEGFGNVIIEAMACGVPVIATRCPSGPEEIITDGRDGLLVPVGDETALAEAMVRLLQDSPARRRLARNARKRSEDFHLERMVRAYEEAIAGAAGAVRR